MSATLLLLLLIWPTLWLLRIALGTKILLGLELRRHRITPLATDALPGFLLEAGRPAVAALEALGFRLVGGWHATSAPDDAFDDLALVLLLPDTPIRALVRLRIESERADECTISLRTTLASGVEIATVDYVPEPVWPNPAALALESQPDATPAALLARHRERIAAEAATAWICGDLASAALREQYIQDGIFEHLRSNPEFREHTSGVLSLRFKPAWRRARALQRFNAKKKLAAGKRTAPAIVSASALTPEAQFEIDRRHYRQFVALSTGRLSLRAKTIVALVSFCAFAAALGWLYSPVVAITLLVALVVHEGGHLLGMRWFGYRNTQLLFIPFFGGAAIGHDDKVLAPWKHIVIILLGPLPGLFVGLAAFGYFSGQEPAWLGEAALTVVVLNGFNLLPILPLDGGQIVDFAFVSRFPRARVLFVGLSALCLIGFGLMLGEVMLLGILGVLALLRLPTEWRLAALARGVRSEYPEGGDEEPILRRLLAGMRDEAWKKIAASQRLLEVRGLMTMLRMPRPGFGTLCFAALGYTAPLWLGGPLLVAAINRKEVRALAGIEESIRTAGLDRTPPAAFPVPDEANAAIPFIAAEALAGTPRTKIPPPLDPQVLALLHDAAGKPAFVPPRPEPPGRNLASTPTAHERGVMLQRVLDHARERLRFGEAAAAAEIVVDVVRLARLLDSAPGYWSWHNHRETSLAAWTLTEEISATAPALAPELARRLLPLLDEQHETALAAKAAPRDLVEAADVMLRMSDPSNPAALHGWRSWVTAAFVNASAIRVNLLQQALDVHARFDPISRGQWPESALTGTAVAEFDVTRLAELVARLRQARAGLQIVVHRAGGVPCRSLDSLGLRPAELEHPLSRVRLEWTRRGNHEVLQFPAPPSPTPLEDALQADWVWRLPAHPAT